MKIILEIEENDDAQRLEWVLVLLQPYLLKVQLPEKLKPVGERMNMPMESTWPPEVRALAGAWRNFPLAEELRKAEGRDIPREPF